MKWAAFIYYKNQDKTDEFRPAHREYLAGLKKAGKLFASGRFEDGSGALIVYETESEAEARELIANDPFNKAEIFDTYDVKPWALTTLVVPSE